MRVNYIKLGGYIALCLGAHDLHTNTAGPTRVCVSVCLCACGRVFVRVRVLVLVLVRVHVRVHMAKETYSQCKRDLLK